MLEKNSSGDFPPIKIRSTSLAIVGRAGSKSGLTSGSGPYFGEDRRPSIAAQYLGFKPGALHGMNILELGPLEGAHTYQLAKLGADRILAIEANAEAFLKCLVVK